MKFLLVCHMRKLPTIPLNLDTVSHTNPAADKTVSFQSCVNGADIHVVS